MQLRRARVAISVESVPKMIHVGHARTLLLGSLIAEERGCPFHVRLDGIRRLYPTDTTFATLDVANCLLFLGIECDLMYWIQNRYPDLESMEDELGRDGIERVRDVLSQPGFTPSEFPGIIADDCLLYHPSLIVRGMEFKIPEMYGGSNPMQGAAYTAAEDLLFRAAGREKYEVNTPLITVDDGVKISKRSALLIHWECLLPLGRELARSFLVATAVDPVSPFEVIDRPFSESDMSDRSYPWSWHDYVEAARRT